MKLFAGLLTLALSFASLASSGESRSFVYDGSQNSVELVLRGEETHTEYRYEDRQSICYRTEIVGYRTVCHSSPGPGPGHRPGPGPRQCYRQPIYRQVSYPCMQTVRIPYEVKDFDVDARVVIDVTNLSNAISSGETFTASLKGDTLKFTAKGSKKFVIVLKKQSVRSNLVGAVKYMDAFYAVELVEAAPILKAINVNKVSVKKPLLTFEAGVNSNPAISYSLKVVKNKTLGSDDVLFNRELASTELNATSNEVVTTAQVNLDNLGVKLSSGKFKFTVKAQYNVDGEVMNLSQFEGGLDSSKTLSYKLR